MLEIGFPNQQLRHFHSNVQIVIIHLVTHEILVIAVTTLNYDIYYTIDIGIGLWRYIFYISQYYRRFTVNVLRCFSGDCNIPGNATLLYDILFVGIYK